MFTYFHIFFTVRTPRRQPMSAVLNGKLDSMMSLVTEQRDMLLRQEKEKEELRKEISDLHNDFSQLREAVNQGSVAPKPKKKAIPRDLSVSFKKCIRFIHFVVQIPVTKQSVATILVNMFLSLNVIKTLSMHIIE